MSHFLDEYDHLVAVVALIAFFGTMLWGGVQYVAEKRAEREWRRNPPRCEKCGAILRSHAYGYSCPEWDIDHSHTIVWTS